MRTTSLPGSEFNFTRPSDYPPGVLRCQHCGHIFPRPADVWNTGKMCPQCNEPHGNKQVR